MLLKKIIIFICVICCYFASCSLKPSGKLSFDEKSFFTNRAEWQKHAYNDYRFSFALHPDSSYAYSAYRGEVVVRTKSGKVHFSNEKSEISTGDAFYFDSIDALYNLIYSEYNTYKTIKESGCTDYDVSFAIAYDSNYHYPCSIACNVFCVGDDDFSWSITITDFAVLQ